MAGFLLAAIALLLSERRWQRIAGYALLFLATAYRYNAAAPTFPLILVMFDWQNRLPWLKRKSWDYVGPRPWMILRSQ